MTPIGIDITKRNEMACSSGELHAICFLWAHIFYVLILPIFTTFFQTSSLLFFFLSFCCHYCNTA